MSQISLYLDAETAAQLKRAAKAAGVSQSRFVSELIRQRTAAEWPQQVREALGTWADDFPLTDEIRKRNGRDVRRARM